MLIAYGVLPSNLVLLGVTKKFEIQTGIGEVYLLFLSVLPFGMLFIYMKSKIRKCYLDEYFLNFRAFLTTLITLALAFIINFYAISISNIPVDPVTHIVNAYLFALGGLTITSSLFFSVVSNKAELLGLPDISFEEQIQQIKHKISLLNDSFKDWPEYQGKKKTLEIQKEIDTLMTLFEDPSFQRYGTGSKINKVLASLESFQTILKEIKDLGNETAMRLRWEKEISLKKDSSAFTLFLKLVKLT